MVAASPPKVGRGGGGASSTATTTSTSGSAGRFASSEKDPSSSRRGRLRGRSRRAEEGGGGGDLQSLSLSGGNVADDDAATEQQRNRPISPWSDSGLSASAGLVAPSVASLRRRQQHLDQAQEHHGQNHEQQHEEQNQRRQRILSSMKAKKKRWAKTKTKTKTKHQQRGLSAPEPMLGIGEPPPPPLVVSPSPSATASNNGPRTGRRENRDDDYGVPSATSSESSSVPAPAAVAAPAVAPDGTANNGNGNNGSSTNNSNKRRGFRSMVRVRQTTRKSIVVSTSASTSTSTQSSATAAGTPRDLPSLADATDDDDGNDNNIAHQRSNEGGTTNGSNNNDSSNNNSNNGSSNSNRPTTQIVAQEVATTERTAASNSGRRPIVSILHHSFVEACMPSRLDRMSVDEDDDDVDYGDDDDDDDDVGYYRNRRSNNSNSSNGNSNIINNSSNSNNNIDDDDDYHHRNYCIHPFSRTKANLTHDEEARLQHRLDDIDDPTVQESIECVFAHQLEDGLVGFFDDDDDDDEEEEEEEDWDDYKSGTGGGGGGGKSKSRRRKSALAKLSSRLPSPTGGGPNAFRFFDQQRSRSASATTSARSSSRSTIGGSTTGTADDDASRRRSARSKRNESAVAAVLGMPYELQQTASDAEVLAASRRSISDSSGMGSLSARPSTTTNAAATSRRTTPPLPRPFGKGDRSATTGSIRRVKKGSMDVGNDHDNEEKEDQLAAHELSRRTWSRRAFDSRSLVFIGTIDAEGAAVGVNAGVDSTLSSDADAAVVTCPSCHSGRRHIPHAPPHLWPQAPLLLRPTPGSSTRIRGIRFSGSDQYIWKPRSVDPDGEGGGEGTGPSTPCWSDALNSSWHGAAASDGDSSTKPHTCHECASIPVNNGNERPGEALVVDFESDLFIGTLLIRIRNSNGTTQAPYDDSFGYFTGMNRRYQAVVRGMFKKDGIAMTDCVTGQVLDRKCGKLPPKMLLRGAIKVVSFFAPQLQTKLDGDRPICISPLGSTPQVMRLKRENAYDDSYQADQTIELSQEEPDDLASSLLALIPDYGFEPCKEDTSIARAKVRKKAFDKLYAEKDKSLVFDTSTEYSFEFLQHLIDFETFGVDLGNMIGTVFLKDMLDGQPLKFLAAKRRDVGGSKRSKGLGDIELDYIWSFDIFHECVYSDAKKNND